MHDRRRYKVTDFRFGQLALTLRERAGLRQAEVAGAVGVSGRTIQHWEGGTAFPAAANLQKLIALYLRHGAFTPGHELAEAEAFWRQADESAARRKSLFDEGWFGRLLAQRGEGQRSNGLRVVSASPQVASSHAADWGEAPDTTLVCGRERELATLREWVLEDRCRVVLILGIGGIGKTTLATRFAQEAAPHFDFVLWRSLRHSPSLRDLLVDCINALAEEQNSSTLQSVEAGIKALIDLLRARRCLLVLDDVESLLEAGSLAGRYRAEHDKYRLLFQWAAERAHASCLLLTSREMLAELEPFEGDRAPIRALKLSGLNPEASQTLLEDKRLFGAADDWDEFVRFLAGNPLALKIGGATVRDLFGGDLAAAIAAFQSASPTGEQTLQRLLDDQFGRLSSDERAVLCWLAIEREPLGLEELTADLRDAIPRIDVLAVLRSLQRRSLIERTESGAVFTLQPEVMEYVTGKLVEKVSDALVAGDLRPIAMYALMKGQSKDYVRDVQSRTILQPVLDTLLAHFGDARRLEDHLVQQLRALRKQPVTAHGYAGGNVVNLLVALRGHLRSADCSHVVLRQAYLRGVDARDASLAGSDAGEAVFTEPLETIVSTAMSPDGRYLAIGSFTGEIRVRQAADGKPLWTGKSGTRMVWGLAFSSDATLLASGDYRGKVKLWTVADGRCRQTLEGHSNWVRTVAFSADGSVLASAGDDATIRIWDVQEGTCRHVLQGHSLLIWSVAFSPDGERLVSGSSDGTVRLWDVRTGRCLRTLQTHTSGIYSIALHPDGVTCASGTEDGRITRWNVRTGGYLGSLPRQGTGPASIAFNPEGTLLASGSNEGTVEVWEIGGENDGRRFKALHGHLRLVSCLSFASGGLLASASYGGQVKLWEVTQGVPGGRCLRTIDGFSTLITATAFSPDGALLAQGDDNGLVQVWEVSTGRRLVAVAGHPGPVWAVAFSPDGESFASGGDDVNVKIWEARTGRCLDTLPGHSTVVWSLVFSPDGSYLATGGADRVIQLWEPGSAAPARPVKTLLGSPHWIWSLAFAPPGGLLAAGHTNGSVEIWSTESGEHLLTLRHGSAPIGQLRFSRDGKTLLTSSNQTLLKRWDVKSGDCLSTVPVDNLGNWMKALALNSEGTLVATGSHDRTLQVWQVNPENGTYHVTSYAGHAGGVWALALSPDGTMLSSSDDKGVTLLWDVSTDSLAERVPGRLSSDRPYERMNIYGINGLNEAQRAALRALGAVEDEESALAGRQTAGGRPALVLLGPDEGSEPPARQSR